MMRSLEEEVSAVLDGRTTPSELVASTLSRIEEAQPRLNLFTTVLAREAEARARDLHHVPPGPLHGVPIVVKDLFDVAGAVTTGCCAAWPQERATANAVAVEALLRAGAIVVAKTNQQELGCGANGIVSSFGPAVNPWGEGRMTGGSSGGSAAAVGGGIVTAALGTDAGGSVRIPASFCGATALKPTHGAVSLRGAMPTAPSVDTVGVIARTAKDCLQMFGCIVGHDPLDPVSVLPRPQAPVADLRNLRIGRPAGFFRLLHPETLAAVERTAHQLEDLGATVVDLDGPDPDDGVAALVGIALCEIAHSYRSLWEDDRVSPEIRTLFELGRARSAMDYVDALMLARKVRQSFHDALARVDLLLTPATPFPAPRLDETTVAVAGGQLDTAAGPARLTNPVSVALLPALAFPVGFSTEGLPLGAQLVGPAWSEEMLCTVGAAYQAVTDWHTRRPDAVRTDERPMSSGR